MAEDVTSDSPQSVFHSPSIILKVEFFEYAPRFDNVCMRLYRVGIPWARPTFPLQLIDKPVARLIMPKEESKNPDRAQSM